MSYENVHHYGQLRLTNTTVHIIMNYLNYAGGQP